ncbi:MAG: COX15/CtaA family protein [Hyphomicrobiales bacterium]|nr:COX15/CtaA family protein [Hyphomicrobiales bacterium]
MVSANASADIEINTSPAVRWWLYALCLLIFAMIIVGGATRLTDSGLSITEWKPILGIIPPLNDIDWQDAFAKYKQIPEYRLVNKGMSLAEFKFIFWWEWAHRFLGRMIGFAFLLPFLFFWLTGRIEKGLISKLIVMFVLGGLQGALGWYMVASGLVDRVDVSQYRLAAHLSAAILIIGYIFWVALSLRPARAGPSEAGRGLVLSAVGLTALVFLQIALGAFVAGLDAGMGYNTWPLMDGALVPGGLGAMAPWYANLFENALTVQFNHRVAAYAVLVWTLLHTWRVIMRAGEGPFAVSAGVMTLAVLLQVGLGIWTLLAQVPVGLALLHQGGAVLVLAIALIHLHQLARAQGGILMA